MKWIYVSTLYLSAILICICFFYSRAKPRKNILEKAIRRLMLFVISAVAVNATAVLMPEKQPALIFYGIYHCCVDAMSMALIYYVRKYTGIRSGNAHEMKIMGIASLLDC